MLGDGVRLVAANDEHLAALAVVNPIARAMQFEIRLPVRRYHELRDVHRNPIHSVGLHALARNWLHPRNLASIPFSMYRVLGSSKATIEVLRLQQKSLIESEDGIEPHQKAAYPVLGTA